jgi:hypothetical protein
MSQRAFIDQCSEYRNRFSPKNRYRVSAVTWSRNRVALTVPSEALLSTKRYSASGRNPLRVMASRVKVASLHRLMAQ